MVACVSQSTPVAAVPCVHVQTFVSHWRSALLDNATLSYWLVLHVVAAGHTRSDVIVGAAVSYVFAAQASVCTLQLASWWSLELW